VTLEDLGYNNILEEFRTSQNLENFQAGRVIAEHKERYIIRSEKREFEAQITGNMRHSAGDRSDYPAVGDWVAFAPYDPGTAIIYCIFPRRSVIERQAVGKFGEKQIIAVNIDYAFITLAADRDFNINRIERYLTICYSARVEPIIILTKTDLIDDEGLKTLLAGLKSRIRKVTVIQVSNLTKKGYDKLNKVLHRGKTYCFLGSSGAGKSTTINNLAGKEILKTGSISTSTGKGRHTTNYRELIILENGSILIDNPGMREVGVAETEGGLEATFDTITRLAEGCKFNDCSHIHEKGCAVIKAVEKGIIDEASYKNYLKVAKERKRFGTSVAEKRKKDKAFGKLCKEGVKYRKQNKY
jgi:ribosome biogenesis GTPase